MPSSIMLAQDDWRCRSGETRVVVGQCRGSVFRALLHRPAAPHSRWAWWCVTAAESRKPHGCEGSASWSERRGLQHALRPSRATRTAPSPLLLLPALLALLTLTPALAAPLGSVRTGRLERAESQWERWRHAKGAVGHGAGVRKRLYVLPAESNAPRPLAAATAASPALAAASPAAPATNNSGASSASTRPDSGDTGAGAGAAGTAEAAAIPDDRASLLPCPMVTSATQGGTDGSGGLGGVLSLLRVVQAGDGGGDEGDEAAGQRGSLSRVDPMDGFRRYRGPYNVTDVHYWASAAFTGWWAAAVGVILCLLGIVLVGLILCFRQPLSCCHVAISKKGARARVAAEAGGVEGATEAERVSGRGTERGKLTGGRAGRGEQSAVPSAAAGGAGIVEATGGRLEACVQGHKPMAGSSGAHWPHVDMCTSPPAASWVSAPDMGNSIAITRSASSSLSSFSSFSSFSSPRTSSASSATRPSVSSSLSSSSSASSSAPFLSLSSADSAPIGLRHVASELSVPWEGEECEAWGQEEKKPCQRGAEEGISNTSGSNSVATAPRGTGASREAGGVGAEGREKTGWGRAVRLGWQVVRWVLLAASLLLAIAAVGVALYASASFRPIAVHTRDSVITSIAAAINKLDHMAGTLTAAYAVFNRTLSDPSLLLPAQPPPPQVQAQQKQQMGSAWAAPESGGGASGSSVQAGDAGGARSSTNGPCGSSSGGNGTAGGSQQGWGNAVGRVGGEGSGNGSMDAASILVFARRALVSVHTLQRQAHKLEGTVERVAQRAFSITTTTLISLMAASCLLLLLSAIPALGACRGRRQCLAVHLLSMAVLLALLLVAWLLAAVFSSARVMLRDSCAEMALYAASPAASTLAPLLPCINPRAARIARVNAARGANQLVGFANAQIESGNAALGGLARMLRSAGLLETSAPGGGDASGAGGGGTAVASSAVEGAGGAARAGGLRGRGSSMGMVSSSSVAEAGSGGGNSEAAVPDAAARTEQSSTALSPGGNSSSSSSSSGEDRVIPLLCPVFNESSNLAPAVCPAGYGSVRSFEQDYAAYHCESENPVICVRRGTPIPNSSYHLLASAAAATASVADLVPDMYDLATCQFLVDLFHDLSSTPQGCYGAKSKVQLEWVAFIMFGVALAMLALACIIALYSHTRKGDGTDGTGQ
ncbi:unnamed protein product [Closterium sp. NIES-64]|nr:unnamed protein product [Closterium sp. NIES-64]